MGDVGTPVALTSKRDSGAPVNVEAVDFNIEEGVSILRVTLDNPSTVITPSQKGMLSVLASKTRQ